MGSAVEIKVQEINKLARKLNEYVLSGGDKSTLLKSLGMVIEEQTKERFDTKRDPEGNAWREVTDAYQVYLAKHFPASSLLIREGYLQMTIEHQLKGGDTVLIGSPMEYADYHQNAKNEKHRRQFLGFGTDNITELQDIVDEFIKERVA